jgi:hypothetical protein
MMNGASKKLMDIVLISIPPFKRFMVTTHPPCVYAFEKPVKGELGSSFSKHLRHRPSQTILLKDRCRGEDSNMLTPEGSLTCRPFCGLAQSSSVHSSSNLDVLL